MQPGWSLGFVCGWGCGKGAFSIKLVGLTAPESIVLSSPRLPWSSTGPLELWQECIADVRARRKWWKKTAGDGPTPFPAPKELSLLPSVLCIHGIQVLGLDDPGEQVVPKEKHKERVSLCLCSIFLSVPKLLGEWHSPSWGGHKVGDSKTNQSCKQTLFIGTAVPGSFWKSLLLSAGKEREHPRSHRRKVALLELCHH